MGHALISMLKKIYFFIFARKFFYKLNTRLLLLNLHSLGIQNYENYQVSGEACFLKNYLMKNPQPLIFDVGANVGNYSLIINSINPQATIYAFEPHPQTFEKLTNNTLNKNIICTNIGMGSKEDKIALFDYKNVAGSSHASLYPEVFDTLRNTEKTSTLVNISTLDLFCKENHINKIDFLKIDTEGHELEVLKGAKHLLATNNIDIIQFEFNEMNTISRIFFKDFCQLLPNYQFYRLLPNDLIPLQPYSPILCELFAFQNIIAINNKLSLNQIG